MCQRKAGFDRTRLATNRFWPENECSPTASLALTLAKKTVVYFGPPNNFAFNPQAYDLTNLVQMLYFLLKLLKCFLGKPR